MMIMMMMTLQTLDGLALFCSKQQKANSEKNNVESFKTNQFVR